MKVFLLLALVSCVSARAAKSRDSLKSLLESLSLHDERAGVFGANADLVIQEPEPEQGVIGQSFSSRTELTEALLQPHKYNPDVNPDVSNGPIVVNHTFETTNIVSFKDEVLTLQGWQELTWYDKRLQWTPESSVGITSLLIPDSKVWVPDIMLMDSGSEFKGYRYGLNVEVFPDGKVLFEPPVFESVICPFEEEKLYLNNTVVCEMKFTSWTYDAFMIDLHSPMAGLDNIYLNPKANRNWRLVSSSARINREVFDCCPDDPYVDITYTLVLKRVDKK